MGGVSVELIEFIRPIEHDKTLFISNIPSSFEEDDLRENLIHTFSKFGLIYEVITKSVLAGESNHLPPAQVIQGGETCFSPQHRQPFYAFVKFYSMSAARAARRNMAGRFFLKGQSAKIKFALKKNELEEKIPLFFSKCYDLANHYLGFNSWNVKIVKNSADNSDTSPPKVISISVVKLEILNHHIHCFGFAEAHELWEVGDKSTRCIALCKARKRAFQFAVQDAFSKIVLAVLSNGKVFAEVNTTVDERVNLSEDIETDSLLTISELDAPTENSDAEEEGEEDVDLINQRILAELEDAN